MKPVATLVLFVALFVDPVALRNPWPRCVPPSLESVPFDSIVTAGDTIRFSAGLWRNDQPLVVPMAGCGAGRDRRISLACRLWTSPSAAAGFAQPDSCVVVRASDAWFSMLGWHPEGASSLVSAGMHAPPVALGDSVTVLVRFLDRNGTARWIANGTRAFSAQ